MSLRPLSAPRFIRRTSLGPNEYRKNFRQIDREIIEAVSSPAADAVTPLMSKIYLRMVNAPDGCWERDGVLRFESELREAGQVKAWSVLCEVLGVASATANKALRWMHEQGIIGYFAGKNGVGIRVFLNRAASSVGKKILQFPPASSGARPASPNETAFSDSFAVSEVSDSDINPRAPKNGADNRAAGITSSETTARTATNSRAHVEPGSMQSQTPGVISLDVVITRLKAELEPAVHAAARQAAAREHERTREWLENRGLPKAARVAQHEAYNVLRKYGVIGESARGTRSHADVGRSVDATAERPPLTHEEIADLAGACVAMLETKGQSIDLTLSEMGTAMGGFLTPAEAVKVREKANSLLLSGHGGEGKVG